MQFIDLHRQYEILEERIERRIAKVLKHKRFIMGPEVEELEEALARYTGRKHVLSCSNGTDALLIPLLEMKLSKEDAFFLPSFTFFATAEVVNLAGATPVFVDSDESFNMSPACLREAIERTVAEGSLRPRGIIAVDLFGLPADYEQISSIAGEFGLFVMEDAAQSFGAVAHGKKAGAFGDVATTSFFPAKPLGCYGDGGAIFLDDDEKAAIYRSIRVHGQGNSRYNHVRIGLNARLDTLQAAILLAKMEILDEEMERRQEIAAAYDEGLKDVCEIPLRPDGRRSAWAQYSILLENAAKRDALVRTLGDADIPTMIYYECPLHRQPVYAELPYPEGSLPVCEDYGRRILSLPMHPYLKKEELTRIVAAVRQGSENSLFGVKMGEAGRQTV